MVAVEVFFRGFRPKGEEVIIRRRNGDKGRVDVYLPFARCSIRKEGRLRANAGYSEA
jgi:hypothetical protein